MYSSQSLSVSTLSYASGPGTFTAEPACAPSSDPALLHSLSSDSLVSSLSLVSSSSSGSGSGCGVTRPCSDGRPPRPVKAGVGVRPRGSTLGAGAVGGLGRLTEGRELGRKDTGGVAAAAAAAAAVAGIDGLLCAVSIIESGTATRCGHGSHALSLFLRSRSSTAVAPTSSAGPPNGRKTAALRFMAVSKMVLAPGVARTAGEAA
jgi:hypothetical protein